MDIRKVKKLIELLEESGIAEIEIKEGEESVRISRHPASLPAAAPEPLPQVAQPVATAEAAAPAASAAQASAAPASDTPEGHKVLCPMVGTYYEAPSPNAEPFVRIGDEVRAGDTLCIVEAMKMMNQIEADVGGRITAIQAVNGEPVEFGQVLFIIT
jgi:acetyl-CoA carboxylase biotin carboxyl carrier protein